MESEGADEAGAGLVPAGTDESAGGSSGGEELGVAFAGFESAGAAAESEAGAAARSGVCAGAGAGAAESAEPGVAFEAASLMAICSLGSTRDIPSSTLRMRCESFGYLAFHAATNFDSGFVSMTEKSRVISGSSIARIKSMDCSMLIDV